jgi:hypothetical protein
VKRIQPVERRISNMSEYHLTAVLSDCATSQRNTPDILSFIIETCNTDKKLEQLEVTQIYQHRTDYKRWTQNLD